VIPEGLIKGYAGPSKGETNLDIVTIMTLDNVDPPPADIDEKRSPGTPGLVPRDRVPATTCHLS
jgi:hypothetical protein